MASIISTEETNTIQSTLQLDPNQPGPPPPAPPPPPPQVQQRKRKKIENGGEASSSAEPRRLRRSHEACARCRNKKIKASPAGLDRRQLPCSADQKVFRSATLNIRVARLVLLLALHANKKTATVGC
jgi:hypothetical protein